MGTTQGKNNLPIDPLPLSFTVTNGKIFTVPEPSTPITRSRSVSGSSMIHRTAYDEMETDNHFHMKKEFKDLVPEQLLKMLEQHGGFKFRLNDYPGKENKTELVTNEYGSAYYGQIDSRKRKCGQGYYLSRGTRLTMGYFLDDVLEGPGLVSVLNVGVFRGNWNSNVLDGQGEYFGADGSTYKGNWFNNLQEGYGEEVWPQMQGVYRGEFRRGVRHGRGHLMLVNEQAEYKGHFSNGKFEGDGEYRWGDGKVYDGEWHEDQMHGKGVFTWPDGRKYEGEYKFGKKDGFGIFTWPSGKRYEGFWFKGYQQGSGILVEEDGLATSGIWAEGLKDTF